MDDEKAKLGLTPEDTTVALKTFIRERKARHSTKFYTGSDVSVAKHKEYWLWATLAF